MGHLIVIFYDTMENYLCTTKIKAIIFSLKNVENIYYFLTSSLGNGFIFVET